MTIRCYFNTSRDLWRRSSLLHFFSSSSHASSPPPAAANIAETKVLANAFPEWMAFMDMLTKQGFFGDKESPINSEEFCIKDLHRMRTACLNFARERYDLLKSLPRSDIKIIAEYGCPSIDRKVVNSGKRLRAYAGVKEENVCSSCNVRGSCDRAYVEAGEDEEGRTVDVLRLLFNYIHNVLSGTNQSNRLLSNQTVMKSMKNLLQELIDNGNDQLPSNPSNEEQTNIKKVDWVCTSCKAYNFSRNIKCFRCNALQNRPTPMKGDWICEKCKFFNFAKNSKCKECKSKPSNRNLNPGEWSCDSCNFINFRRNAACLKCGHRRPKALLHS